MLRAMALAAGEGATVTAPTMVALRATSTAPLADGALAYLSGYYTDADGGEGMFVWRAASVGGDNQGTIILPTGQSSLTPGRWIRAKHDNRDIYPVRWYGAKGDGATNDTAAFNFCITDCATTKAFATAIGWVYLSGGRFMTDGHLITYTDVAFLGAGAEITRWVHRDGNAKPLVYMVGGVANTAAPYGGFKGIQMLAGNQTYPSVLYIDTCIDNQFMLDDVAFGGSSTNTSICDGISFFDFLNASWRKFRSDSTSGYSVRIRGSSAKGTLSGTSGTYKIGSLNAGTGVWTFTVAQTLIVPGSAVMAFSTGTLPTDAATTLPLVSGPGGGVYFAGTTTASTMIIYKTIADAKAGTNPVTFSDTGSGTHGFATFGAYYAVTSVDPTGDTVTFTNDKNIIIATSVAESGRQNVYGSGMTGTGTIVAGGAGAAGGLHTVFIASDGAVPGGLTAGIALYPIYVSPTQIKFASSVANAVAGIAIDITDAGSGNITLMYDHQASQLGLGGFSIREMTYDNAACGTIETINGVACGGLGILYADYSQFDYKGPITIEGHRIEINKMIARDTVWGSSKRAMIRVEPSGNAKDNTGVQVLLKGLAFDVSAGIATTNAQGSHIRVVGNRGTVDLAPSFAQCRTFGIGVPYDNDTGTATSKVLGTFNGHRQVLDGIVGYQANLGNAGRLDGSVYSSNAGQQTTSFAAAQLNNSMTKPQDVVWSLDNAVVLYKATQTQPGWCVKDGTSSIGTTVTGTTGAGAVFTLAGNPSNINFNIGVAVSIAGAGAAGAALVGIVQDYDLISATKTLTLGDSAGNLNPCLTNVAGAAVTYPAATLASVGAKYTASASLNFPNTVTLSSSDLTINAPTGVTFTAGKVVNLGLPSNVPAGMVYNAFVTAGGATVTVRATNCTALSIDPAAGTFAIEVAV